MLQFCPDDYVKSIYGKPYELPDPPLYAIGDLVVYKYEPEHLLRIREVYVHAEGIYYKVSTGAFHRQEHIVIPLAEVI